MSHLIVLKPEASCDLTILRQGDKGYALSRRIGEEGRHTLLGYIWPSRLAICNLQVSVATYCFCEASEWLQD